jgi:hypothetical protein
MQRRRESYSFIIWLKAGSARRTTPGVAPYAVSCLDHRFDRRERPQRPQLLRHPCEGFKETRGECNYNLRKGERYFGSALLPGNRPLFAKIAGSDGQVIDVHPPITIDVAGGIIGANRVGNPRQVKDVDGFVGDHIAAR